MKIQYHFNSSFHEGLASALFKGKYGFINHQNQWVIQPVYEYAAPFSCGCSRVKNTLFYFIDASGKKKFKNAFGEIHCFSEELAAYEENYLFGYIDIHGEKILPPAYYIAGPFCNGTARVMEHENTGFYFIKKDGKKLCDDLFFDCQDFSENCAWIKKNSESLWSCINMNGKKLFNREFSEVRSFSHGYAGVKINGKWGFINDIGEIVIESQFEDVTVFSEDFAPVKKNGKWGFIDRNGVLKIREQFDYAHPFSEGKALCLKGNIFSGEWFFIE